MLAAEVKFGTGARAIQYFWMGSSKGRDQDTPQIPLRFSAADAWIVSGRACERESRP